MLAKKDRIEYLSFLCLCFDNMDILHEFYFHLFFKSKVALFTRPCLYCNAVSINIFNSTFVLKIIFLIIIVGIFNKKFFGTISEFVDF